MRTVGVWTFEALERRKDVVLHPNLSLQKIDLSVSFTKDESAINYVDPALLGLQVAFVL
jgi:hypothetical protein